MRMGLKPGEGKAIRLAIKCVWTVLLFCTLFGLTSCANRGPSYSCEQLDEAAVALAKNHFQMQDSRILRKEATDEQVFYLVAGKENLAVVSFESTGDGSYGLSASSCADAVDIDSCPVQELYFRSDELSSYVLYGKNTYGPEQKLIVEASNPNGITDEKRVPFGDEAYFMVVYQTKSEPDVGLCYRIE